VDRLATEGPGSLRARTARIAPKRDPRETACSKATARTTGLTPEPRSIAAARRTAAGRQAMQDERTNPVGSWPDDDEAARERTRQRGLPAHEVDPAEVARRPDDDDEPVLDRSDPLEVRGPTG
jgi:hypothetical protein